MTSTLQAGYPSSGNALTCTLASLANSTTAGRSSTGYDNSSNKYPDIALSGKLKTNGSAPTGEKGSFVYVWASVDGTNNSGSSAEAVGTDVAVTFDANTNLVGPFFVSMPAAGTTYHFQLPSMKELFGFCPVKGGLVINNQTGNAYDSTAGNHGVYWTALQEGAV